LIVEEPLEIRLNAKTITITMRTPGNDFVLATGFLFAEGIIKSIDDVETIRHCGMRSGQTTSNIVRVILKPGVGTETLRLDRHFYASSSCGVCGKASLEALAVNAQPFEPQPFPDSELICALPNRLREAQTLFYQTGSLHGAALFDRQGKLLLAHEDVGRHNAVDKVIGEMLTQGRAAEPSDILCISGRASFEILQKAIVARIACIVAVGAPSSLAVDLAQRFNLTLIGFAGEKRFNVYTPVIANEGEAIQKN
jgi:FdhD protein